MNTTTVNTFVANYVDIYKDACKAGDYAFTVRVINKVISTGNLQEFTAMLENS
jgi:hypothetical protein